MAISYFAARMAAQGRRADAVCIGLMDLKALDRLIVMLTAAVVFPSEYEDEDVVDAVTDAVASAMGYGSAGSLIAALSAGSVVAILDAGGLVKDNVLVDACRETLSTAAPADRRPIRLPSAILVRHPVAA